MPRPVVYHIPVCPFSQRIEILLALKGLQDAVDFHVVDITRPRPDWLAAKTGGPVPLPVLETEDGRILRESLVLLRYVEERFAGAPVARADAYERAVERLMIARENAFATAGYAMVMNRDRGRTAAFRDEMLAHYRWLNDTLEARNPGGLWLFDRFGLAETVFAPLMMRFWFLDYYEDFALPEAPEYARVRRWREACLAHPAAQQVTPEQIVKLYYDYAVGAGNGALPEGRRVSSFAFEPDWPDRPMPPKDKYDRIAGDAELGLV
ncbi:glutathione S-transferase family protein [Rhodobacteraceae bacterium 2CG4]|uniref:Glutathione S-transferase family protein n=1 Tax=Halovulum marinum TaxID=2662447 RepID=A0A6L5YUI4_9RHOB|nr:glutathione S-transferase family protein [Halovulum marinum]MSU88086.1 glutathione S-transferase family protein [Halovulum marinum]